jgi:putative sterol carrier protein
MAQLFSNEWAVAWGEALNQSEPFRTAGASWVGTVVLEALADPARGLPTTMAVFLDLDRGTCRAARVATADDMARSEYVISGALSVWLTVLNGELAPTTAIMFGKLKLKQGSLGGLMPHVHAATALVKVAREVEREA